ncbi:DUF6152 family protein [Sphingobium sp.]|uniref:DUF6152 family protein n=1 Tax=Sphingobium sp. TaxID=1912891 RepID=UPI0028BDC445|nr:DUF6152 family protein [Sphingobium sp.]
MKFLKMAVPLILAATTMPASAHHSFAMFDKSKVVTISGSLYAVEWKNPHGWFWIKVQTPDGRVQTWGLEGASPGVFAREGVKKSDFIIGEKVKVDLHPLRNNQTGGQFLRLTFRNGKQVGKLTGIGDEFRKKGYIR